MARRDRKNKPEEEEKKESRRNSDLKLIPITFNESVSLYLTHDGEPAETETETTGKFTIENTSEKDRIWDVLLDLDDTGSTDLDGTIEIREINPGESEETEYKVKGDPKNILKVSEEFSLDEENPSYSLILGEKNEIFGKITVHNDSDEDLKNLEIIKFVPAEYEDVSVDTEDVDGDRAIKWTINDLPAGRDEIFNYKLYITVEDKDTKVRSGKVLAKYTASYLLSGLKADAEKFKSSTNNNVYLSVDELDESPNRFECKFVFENKSEFDVKLLEADVHDADAPSKNFVSVGGDTNLSEGETWASDIWEYDVEEGIDPQFIKIVDFTCLADVTAESLTSVDIEDFELAVAALEADLKYDAEELASYRETVFHAIAWIENTGGADLNEVHYRETVQNNFKPPLAEEVEVKYNGEILDNDIYTVTISPDNNSSDGEHEVVVELNDLADTTYGAFHPGDKLDITYPITADRPAMDVEYLPDAYVKCNTLPAGKPIEIVLKPEGLVIPVIHVRKRFITGKDTHALDQSGKYVVTLWTQNMGNMDMVNYELHDSLPEGATIISEVVQRLGEYDDVPEEVELEKIVEEVAAAEDEDVAEDVSKVRRQRIKGPKDLVWTAEKIPPNERFTVKYVVKKDKK
ncbi:MAG: hypothetical protein ACTSRE_02910 [Promethearchaeota archaeon]